MPVKRQVWPRRVRRAVQGVAFGVFAVFVAAPPMMWASRWQGEWFMRLSPLSALGSSMSARQVMWAFWPAVALLAGAAVLGRFFCGWLCPLDVMLDVADRAKKLTSERLLRTLR